MQAQVLIEAIEAYAPLSLAEDHDPTGLQIGDPSQEIHRVMTTLDLRPEVVAEAIEQRVDFIFAHHPVMFHPAKNLDFRDPQKAMYADLIRHGIVVYAAHTNLDAAAGGMNDWLAQLLGIHEVVPLLANPDGQTGLGRIGRLAQETTVAEYATFVRQQFGVDHLRVITPDLNRTIEQVAVIGGDGGRYYRQAQAAGADVLVTADLYYHTGHDVLADDFVVIDPDHHMEAIVKEKMADLIRTWQSKERWQLTAVVPSQVNTDPYTYI